MNDFVSLRRLDGRFHYPGRKSRFGPKLREVKMTFSPPFCTGVSWRGPGRVLETRDAGVDHL